jgi:hypothetical protein
MCGNFGLLALGLTATNPENSSHHNSSFHKPASASDRLDMSINESMHEVSRLEGIRFRNDLKDEDVEEPLSAIKILEAQTACTEIRGGQAGGFSSIEYKLVKNNSKSHFDALFAASEVAIPTMHRVRMVARKRHPLAADLSKLYVNHRHGTLPNPKDTITGNHYIYF